jgi:hypothetical protein
MHTEWVHIFTLGYTELMHWTIWGWAGVPGGVNAGGRLQVQHPQLLDVRLRRQGSQRLQGHLPRLCLPMPLRSASTVFSQTIETK